MNNSVALIRGSSCLFSSRPDFGRDYNPWVYYVRDFMARVQAATDAGAVGVLFGEGVTGGASTKVMEKNTGVPPFTNLPRRCSS